MEAFSNAVKVGYSDETIDKTFESEMIDENDETNDDMLYSKSYERSPFYKRYFIMYSNLKKENNNVLGDMNEFYCEKFFVFCIEKYLTYYPLWGSSFLKGISEKTRVSNADIENWFRLVKHNYLPKLHMKAGRFIDVLDKKNLQLRNSIEFVPHKKTRRRKNTTKTAGITNEKGDDENDPNDPKNEEKWKKSQKLPSQPKHLGPRVVKRYNRNLVVNNSNIDLQRESVTASPLDTVVHARY